MEKQFQFNGITMKVFWNGKTYNGTRYFTVKGEIERFGAGAQLTWNSERGWTKNGGMPYTQTIEKLFDLRG